MHKAKQIAYRLLEAENGQPGDIKEFISRRQPASRNMENRFALRNRARRIAGQLLELDIGRSGR